MRYEHQRILVAIPVGYANVQNLTLRNVHGMEGDFRTITLVGASKKYNIDGVQFENVTVGGKLLTKAALSEGMVLKFADNVTFD